MAIKAGLNEVPIKDEAVKPLFTPHQVGRYALTNRMVYAPMTRSRATDDYIPQPHLMAPYYAQRAVPGTLFIAEGTYTSPEAVGYARAPGIWSDEQVEAWKPIVKAVKDKGAVFFDQLWHVGRVSHPVYQPNGGLPVAPSPVGIPPSVLRCYLPDGTLADHPVPRALDLEGIKSTIQDYVKAARNAIAAGFDGVEVHAANGYLLEEFIKTGTNKRTDEYGGPIENRCRLPLEVVAAVVAEVGGDRVGVRISPHSTQRDLVDDTPYATYTYLVEKLNQFNLAYLHLVEPRVERYYNPEDDFKDFTAAEAAATLPTNAPFRKVFNNTFIVASGYKAHNAATAVSTGHTDLVAFGRWWLANPDLPTRFKLGAPLNKYDRATFYTTGTKGYLDYPTLEDELKAGSSEP